MQSKDVQIGQVYWGKVSGRSVKVRIESVHGNGWKATNLNSGRKATIKSVFNLDEIVEGRNVHADRRLKKQQEQDKVKELRAKSQQKKVDTEQVAKEALRNAIAAHLDIDVKLIAYVVDCPVSQSYDVDLKDGKKWEVTYHELTEIQSEKPAKVKSTSRRAVRKSPQEKLDWVKQVAAMVERTSIKVAAHDLGKSVTYITRTYRAYTEVYLKSNIVKNAFDSKTITWTQLHKLAEKKVTGDRLEEFANNI